MLDRDVVVSEEKIEGVGGTYRDVGEPLSSAFY
jgi:hypothetical protein